MSGTSPVTPTRPGTQPGDIRDVPRVPQLAQGHGQVRSGMSPVPQLAQSHGQVRSGTSLVPQVTLGHGQVRSGTSPVSPRDAARFCLGNSTRSHRTRSHHAGSHHAGSHRTRAPRRERDPFTLIPLWWPKATGPWAPLGAAHSRPREPSRSLGHGAPSRAPAPVGRVPGPWQQQCPLTRNELVQVDLLAVVFVHVQHEEA